jgi:hypothetical protein
MFPIPVKLRAEQAVTVSGLRKEKDIPAGSEATVSGLIGTDSISMVTKESETEIVQIAEWSETKMWSQCPNRMRSFKGSHQ